MVAKILLERLGGTNLEDLGDKTAISEDHTATWNAMLDVSQYEQKAINSTPITVEQGGTASDTITVSVPAGEVNQYIQIKAYVKGYTSAGQFAGNAHTAQLQWRLYKTYLAAEVDLIAQEIYSSSVVTASGSGPSTQDRNHFFTDFYYEPTTDEKTNGFTVSIDLDYTSSNPSGGADGEGTVEYLQIMGI